MSDLRRHSRTLYDGLSRASARSYLLNIGFSHEDLEKPIVGVNHAWIGTMPCNFNHRRLAAWAADGIRQAGATPMEVNTISISDGITMGTEGMKTSLVSRELIADSVELVARGHYVEGQGVHRPLAGRPHRDPRRRPGPRARQPGAGRPRRARAGDRPAALADPHPDRLRERGRRGRRVGRVDQRGAPPGRPGA